MYKKINLQSKFTVVFNYLYTKSSEALKLYEASLFSHSFYYKSFQNFIKTFEVL